MLFLNRWALPIALCLVGCLMVFVAVDVASAKGEQQLEKQALNATRACIPASGHATQLSVNASASTGELNSKQVYLFICDVAVNWETADSAAPTADTNSNYLPADSMIPIYTGGTTQSRYLAAVSLAGGGTCYLTLCE